MKLEDEIKQKKFRNPHHKVLVNLFYTYGVLSSRVQSLLKSSGLTMQQFNILRILRGQHPDPVSNTAVKERLLDRNSDVTRIIDRLMRDGLVRRKSCSSDRRRVDITITEKGLELLEQIDRKSDEMDAIAATITSDEASRLNDLLDKIRG